VSSKLTFSITKPKKKKNILRKEINSQTSYSLGNSPELDIKKLGRSTFVIKEDLKSRNVKMERNRKSILLPLESSQLQRDNLAFPTPLKSHQTEGKYTKLFSQRFSQKLYLHRFKRMNNLIKFPDKDKLAKKDKQS
jgi:hypothetical protein